MAYKPRFFSDGAPPVELDPLFEAYLKNKHDKIREEQAKKDATEDQKKLEAGRQEQWQGEFIDYPFPPFISSVELIVNEPDIITVEIFNPYPQENK